MAMRRARLWLGWLLLPVWSWSACRQVSLCDGHDCAELEIDNAEGGRAGQPTMDPSGSGGADAGASRGPAAMGGAAGEPGQSDAGSNPGGQSSQGPSCRPGTAECDESSFTVCETPTTFSFRNCGGCGKRCEGSCISGKCKPAEVIFEHDVPDFVADASRAFAMWGDGDAGDTVTHVNLKSGESEVIAEGIPHWGKLVLGADRLYVAYDDHVLSMGFDGSGIATETFEPTTFGATKSGAYYTADAGDEAEPSSQYSLWFRPTGASTPESLGKSAGYSIVGSSRASLLVEQQTGDAVELLLVRDRELSSLGAVPENVVAQQPITNGAALLVTNEQAPSGYEVVWLTLNEQPKRFPVEPALDENSLVPAPDGVALILRDRGNTFVRLYSERGPSDVPFGITNFSTLVYVDEHYFWYSWVGTTTGLPYFQRSRQFELIDVIPE